jgi:hypothetical protein
MTKKSGAKERRANFFLETVVKHVQTTNTGAFILGFVLAILLGSNVMGARTFSQVYAVCLLVIILTLVFFKYFDTKTFDRPRWGLISTLLMGYGAGALVYIYRWWFKWIWSKLLLIRTDEQLLLASIFLMGVILGFFVVRNWSKDQADFLTSLSAIFGGVAVAAILGSLDQDITPLKALSYYAPGFALSGIFNLGLSTILTSHYINTGSKASRAVIEFLYGRDKVKAIDEYFLKNFKEDPDYAKRLLVGALRQFREKVLEEYTAKMERRREEKAGQLHYYRLLAIRCDEKEGSQTPVTPIEQSLIGSPPLESPPLESPLGSPPLNPPNQVPARPAADKEYLVIFQKVDRFRPDMFRMGISMRILDNLEYIVAPGEYKRGFPYFGSVAGLALAVRQTIVMDRDKLKKFRTSDHVNGICPLDIEQTRGLDEIDFLSYIAIPVVSQIGNPNEVGLGVIHVDTRLFASPEPLGEPAPATALADLEYSPPSVNTAEKVLMMRCKIERLTVYANYLYNLNDGCVKYLENMRAVAVPIMELYAKCRVGAL